MNIALLGYGRMGRLVEKLALEKNHTVVLVIDQDNVQQFSETNLANADVLIDFSIAEIAPVYIRKAISWDIPVVSGTTGWLDKYDEVALYCKHKGGAFLYSSNFSVGVNIFFKLNQYLASIMNNQSQYEPQIREIHHTHKIDSPSGTAISLANDLISQVDRKSKWQNENSSEKNVLSIMSERIDEVPGTHEITYQSGIDEIQLVHTAKNRHGFASGAIQAAEWILDKKGVFDMDDVLSL